MTGAYEATIDTQPALCAAFAGRRGRLLLGLLIAEFAGAIQTVAYSSVLPLASRELHGSSLYGATLAAGTLTTILTLASGATMRNPRHALLVATALYLVGVLAAAAAPAMVLVLAGSVLRGVAGGVLAGFGFSAIGGLYEDELRRRVLGLFAVMWLLPSLAGPAVNAVVASSFGWRWAMAWPAAVVVVARLLIGRDADLVPWSPSTRRIGLRDGVLVVLGLSAASVAPTTGGWCGLALFGCGVTVAIVASLSTLRTLLGVAVDRLPGLVVFAALTLAFFGGDGLIALAVIDGLGRGAAAGSLALGAGLVTWSVTGLRPPRTGGTRDLAALGLVLLAIALLTVAVAQLVRLGPTTGLVLIVAGWAVGGSGMGLGYPRLSGEAFDGMAAELVTAIATAVVFAETAGSALGALLGGGVYSLGTVEGVGGRTATAAAFCVLGVVAAGAACARQFGGARRLRNAGTSSLACG